MGRKAETKLDEAGNTLKQCSGCGLFKGMEEFPTYGALCVPCEKERRRKSYIKKNGLTRNKPTIDEDGICWKVCNKCSKNKLLSDFPPKRAKCKECLREEERTRGRKWYHENKEKESERKKKSREENLEKYKIRENKYALDHKKENNERTKKWYLDNKDNIEKRKKNQESSSRREKERYKTDMAFKLIKLIRGRARSILKKGVKIGSAVKDLGCSPEELKTYLESKFYAHSKTGEMMTWENHGSYGWHIDHIVPLSSFNLSDREQFLKACHYTNLQPLWAEENLKKGDRISVEYNNNSPTDSESGSQGTTKENENGNKDSR